MGRIRRVPLWVVVGIMLIGLILSQGHSFVPLTVSVAVAGLVVLVFSRGVDRMFGFILLAAGIVLTLHEWRQSTQLQDHASPAVSLAAGQNDLIAVSDWRHGCVQYPTLLEGTACHAML